MRAPTVLLAVSCALPWAPTAIAAQEQAARQVTVDASVWGAAVGYGWAVAPGRLVGLEGGAALPQISVTLVPGEEAGADPDFGEYLYAAVFARFTGAGRYSLDVGLRGSFADLWPCPASDCYPVPFAGPYAQPMVGLGPVTVGGRLAVGWIGETRPSTDGRTFLVALTPIVLRWSF